MGLQIVDPNSKVIVVGMERTCVETKNGGVAAHFVGLGDSGTRGRTFAVLEQV